ncbi:TPA: tandem-type lipoprotein [Staphylococcus argenteus]|uniref:tandem-type lipoprotein n=1 Tax=Staphylococcus argenteus TaxID=985002 RepID=UPI000233FDAB|nr:tandem-type lipoprotein [Staphylococcus argenteus]MBE2131052.1 tandem-type lipoprotein [Staphylococcus argenteus]PNY93847.1 tandem-type lipoprotein [Staphylococcus argenteus]CCE58029.1 putative lipoprotein [Staphylococcus argenteus]SUJ02354.1 putative lipoprotein [Staphylococcus argenteus]HDY9429298.1 tandem-type lipoprotein [Staphylococcus argenteus]
MKTHKNFWLNLAAIIIISIVICGGMFLATRLEQIHLKGDFKKILSTYPIKNLETLYKINGHDNPQYENNGHDTWYIESSYSVVGSDTVLKEDRMLLEVDKNKHKITGDYDTTINDRKNVTHSTDKSYPVKVVNNKIVCTKDVKDPELKQKIESHQFLIQNGDLSSILNSNDLKITHDPTTNYYNLSGKLSNDNPCVKQLKHRYHIPKNASTKVELKGISDLKGNNHQDQKLYFYFSSPGKDQIIYKESLTYNKISEH